MDILEYEYSCDYGLQPLCHLEYSNLEWVLSPL